MIESAYKGMEASLIHKVDLPLVIVLRFERRFRVRH